MNYNELLENARVCIGDYCKACIECNGKVCRNQIPGPGAKGVGDTAIRNYDKWKEIRINMDTLTENKKVDIIACHTVRCGHPADCLRKYRIRFDKSFG